MGIGGFPGFGFGAPQFAFNPFVNQQQFGGFGQQFSPFGQQFGGFGQQFSPFGGSPFGQQLSAFGGSPFGGFGQQLGGFGNIFGAQGGLGGFTGNGFAPTTGYLTSFYGLPGPGLNPNAVLQAFFIGPATPPLNALIGSIGGVGTYISDAPFGSPFPPIFA